MGWLIANERVEERRNGLTNLLCNAKLLRHANPFIFLHLGQFVPMSSAEPYKENSTPKKRSSLPFIIGVVIVAAGAYFLVPFITTQMMLRDEQAKAKAKFEVSVKPEEAPKVEIVVAPKKMEAEKPGSTSLDPEVFFKYLDKDSNGILEGAEVRGRVKDQLVVFDDDADGAVTKEEFATQVRLMRPEEEEEE